MSRNRAWRRKKNFSKAKRKKDILRSYGIAKHWYKYDGQFIKGKIHCSCPLCSAKTSRHDGAGPHYNIADLRQIESLLYKLKEYEMNEDAEFNSASLILF